SRKVVEVDKLGRPDLLERLQREQQPDPGIAAAAGSEHSATARERTQRRLVEQAFHGRTLPTRHCRCIYARGINWAPVLRGMNQTHWAGHARKSGSLRQE